MQSQNVEVQENWKPPFLSNEEFTHLMLEVKLFSLNTKLVNILIAIIPVQNIICYF